MIVKSECAAATACSGAPVNGQAKGRTCSGLCRAMSVPSIARTGRKASPEEAARKRATIAVSEKSRTSISPRSTPRRTFGARP
jgi:hypothetical protein